MGRPTGDVTGVLFRREALRKPITSAAATAELSLDSSATCSCLNLNRQHQSLEVRNPRTVHGCKILYNRIGFYAGS